MRAKYIGETKKGTADDYQNYASLTNSKIYEVDYYYTKDDPVYGATYKLIDDDGKLVVSSYFELINE
jgi:hypothetical protein